MTTVTYCKVPIFSTDPNKVYYGDMTYEMDFSLRKHTQEWGDSETNCPITLEPLERTTVFYHSGGEKHPMKGEAFIEWLNTRANNHLAYECPMCRRQIVVQTTLNPFPDSIERQLKFIERLSLFNLASSSLLLGHTLFSGYSSWPALAVHVLPPISSILSYMHVKSVRKGQIFHEDLKLNKYIARSVLFISIIVTSLAAGAANSDSG